jgi:hypothetical protein
MKTRLTDSIRHPWFVLLPAVVLLAGCASNVQQEKQLVCVLPGDFLAGLDTKDDRFRFFLDSRLRLHGTRYAYIHRLNDTLSVLKTNGMEVKGNFTMWKIDFVACGVGYRSPAPYAEVTTDPSLTSFAFTDKQHKRHIYIEDREADPNLHKSYIPVLRNGIPAVDSSIYKLTRTAYRQVIGASGYSFPRSEPTTNFYFKGQKGPDFRDISWAEADPGNNTYRYQGKVVRSGSAWGDLEIPVINGKAYWDHPLTSYGNIRKSEFGDLCFPFIDTLRKKQGYWVNDAVGPARFDRVHAILFHGKNTYEYVGVNDPASVNASAPHRAYYLVTNNRVSRPYKYISLAERFMNRYGEALPHAKKIMMTDDSVFCYENNQLVYRNRFAHSDSVTNAGFDVLPKSGKIILRIHSEGKAGSFFCVNNDCFPEQKMLPPQENGYYEWQSLHKYLGVSSNRTQYARVEYLYPENQPEYNRIARLYVNDSLTGAFPDDVELIWDHNDGYVLKGRLSSMRNAFLYPHGRDSLEYPKFVAKYYPNGVPEKVLGIRQQEDAIAFGTVEGKIPYVYLNNHFVVNGEPIHVWKDDIQMEITDNDNFYCLLRQNERRGQHHDIVWVNSKVAYQSPKIFDLTDAQNYLSFYSLEGNRLYLVTLNLNDWWTRLLQLFGF